MRIRALFVFPPLLLSGAGPAATAGYGDQLEATFASRVRAARCTICSSQLPNGGRLSVGIRRRGVEHVLESIEPGRERP